MPFQASVSSCSIPSSASPAKNEMPSACASRMSCGISGSMAMHVLMLQPQMIKALGLPMPTDPGYPYK